MPTLYARAMRHAAEIHGDEPLASRLGVTLVQVRLWMQGPAELPPDVFLKLTDILGEHTVAELFSASSSFRRRRSATVMPAVVLAS